MSTKERLLLQTDDDLTRRLFRLEDQRKLLAEIRALHPNEQIIQLQADRDERELEETRQRLLRLKAQTAGL